MSEAHGTGHIIQSLVANVVIAAGKGVAAALTGSGALLAETLHSTADCGNQLLLLMGVKRAQRPPDEEHPLGFGRALYFWSFMVALLLFSGGGVFSVYEGLHKIRHPEPVESIGLGLTILGVSLLVEGWATFANVKDLNARRGRTPFARFLRTTKDSDLVVIFGENSAAVLGLVLAMGALALAKATGDGRWDGVGSLLIGLVLVGVAIFLAVEVKSLLIGERADPEIEEAIHAIFADDPRVSSVRRVITMQQGPSEVMVALKIACPPDLSVADLSDLINTFEERLRARCPAVRWCFVEPDLDLSDDVT